MGFTVCRNCEKRYPACHDTCESYLEEKQKNAEIKNHIKNDRLSEDFAIGQVIKRKIEFQKKSR